MKPFIAFLLLCVVVSCDNKKTTSDKENGKEEENTESKSTWSSDDQNKAKTDCKTFIKAKTDLTAAEVDEFCDCVLGKLQDDEMTFDEFEAVYEKEKRPEAEKEGKAYDKLEKAGKACMDKVKPDKEDGGSDTKTTDDL